MILSHASRFCAIALSTVAAACDIESTRPIAVMSAPSFMTAEWSEWSEPVHLDPPINTVCQDQTPTLSKDELSLYFMSNRPGGLGQEVAGGCQDTNDLWVATRASRDDPWETVVNLGPPVNTSGNEAGPALSPDGRLLFFYRFATQRDIHVAVRDKQGDWGVPASLGPDVNTANDEAGPTYLKHEGDGDGTLYFYRGDPAITTDLYAVRVTKDGETLGPAVAVPILNSVVEDNHAGVRRDGREIFFNSRRPGSVGGQNFDLWVATRENVHDAWSTPVNVGAPVNSQFAEFHPNLSFDGRTLVFISGAARGGFGGFDIWMTTRAPLED
ncbi:MAG: hypothetical protein ACREMI_12275 [Gemmatimonadales bacterium]